MAFPALLCALAPQETISQTMSNRRKKYPALRRNLVAVHSHGTRGRGSIMLGLPLRRRGHLQRLRVAAKQQAPAGERAGSLLPPTVRLCSLGSRNEVCIPYTNLSGAVSSG